MKLLAQWAPYGVAALLGTGGVVKIWQEWGPGPVLLLFILSVVPVGVFAFLQHRRGYNDVLVFVVSLIVGSGIWASVVYSLVGSVGLSAAFGIHTTTDFAGFLEDHAFDPFSAGAIAAIATYFADRASNPLRMVAVTVTLSMVGAVTGFSTHAGVVGMAVGVMIGAYMGIAFVLSGIRVEEPASEVARTGDSKREHRAASDRHDANLMSRIRVSHLTPPNATSWPLAV